MRIIKPSRRVFSAAALAFTLGAVSACSNDSNKGGNASDQGAAAASGRTIDESVPYIEFASDSGGHTVDVLIDFRCPPCKAFNTIYGPDVHALIESKTAVVRVHPRPMLDQGRDSTFSQDSAAAMAAVFAQDPALALEFENAMFAAQAETWEDEDPSLEEIAKIAADIGADEEAQQQILERRFVDWTLNVVEPEAQERKVGTPTVYVDGEQFTGDWQNAEEFRSFIGADKIDN